MLETPGHYVNNKFCKKRLPCYITYRSMSVFLCNLQQVKTFSYKIKTQKTTYIQPTTAASFQNCTKH